MRRRIAMVVLLAPLAAFAALWLAARLWPEEICDPRLGLRVHAQRDARAEGYLLRASDESALRGAVYDLIQGRIRHFEHESAQRMLRYTLAGRRSPHCLRRETVDTLLAGLPWPAGQCVQATPVPAAAHRYVVDSELASGGRLERSRVSDPEGVVLASYHRSQPVPAALLGLACARARPGLHGGFSSVTAFVFKDRWNRVESPTEQSATAAGDVPPLHEVRARLAAEGRLDRRECHLPGWMGETEVHEIELPAGPLEVEARLDPRSTKAGTVLLDVHTPEKAAIIIARAQRPTIWHVHESGRSSIVAFLVQGEGGQAVLGLTPYTRVLISTREHNPATNCSAAELQRIVREITARYGRPRQHRQAMHEGKPAVRYGLGEPMGDGSLLFHYDRDLADFELSEEQD